MARIFQDDQKAWSAWTRTIEAKAGDPGAPYIVQANTILRPLQLSESANSQSLNTFRKLRLADAMPSYQKANQNTYISTGATVSNGYIDYLIALNQVLRSRYPNIDQREVERRLKKFNDKSKNYSEFLKDARRDWQRAKQADPSLSRQEWEEEYGYRDKNDYLFRARDEAYGEYLEAAAPYPDLDRVARALGLTREARQFIKLPMDESELSDQGLWNEFLKTYIDADFNEFRNTETNDSISIEETSSSSTHYESRWSGSASFSYGFFSFGSSASGGTTENHLREDATRVTFKFKNLNKFPVTRGPWFSENLIRLHCRDVRTSDYWGPAGALNLIPQELIFGRGLSVEIETSQRSFDEFRNWYSVSASAGYGFGPFRIGGRGAYSQSVANVQNQSNGTTIRIEDRSNSIYIIGVVSLKVSDLIQLYYEDLARTASRQAEEVDENWTRENEKTLSRNSKL